MISDLSMVCEMHYLWVCWWTLISLWFVRSWHYLWVCWWTLISLRFVRSWHYLWVCWWTLISLWFVRSWWHYLWVCWWTLISLWFVRSITSEFVDERWSLYGLWEALPLSLLMNADLSMVCEKHYLWVCWWMLIFLWFVRSITSEFVDECWFLYGLWETLPLSLLMNADLSMVCKMHYLWVCWWTLISLWFVRSWHYLWVCWWTLISLWFVRSWHYLWVCWWTLISLWFVRSWHYLWVCWWTLISLWFVRSWHYLWVCWWTLISLWFVRCITMYLWVCWWTLISLWFVRSITSEFVDEHWSLYGLWEAEMNWVHGKDCSSLAVQTLSPEGRNMKIISTARPSLLVVLTDIVCLFYPLSVCSMKSLGWKLFELSCYNMDIMITIKLSIFDWGAF